MSHTAAKRHIYTFPGARIVSRGSLLDRSLISLVQNTQSGFGIADPEVSSLPIHLKERLLNYMAFYRSDGVTLGELQTLLTDRDYIEPFSGPISTRIRQADLSNSIGSSISFDELNSSFAFPCLTHLCLAHPGPDISWTSFLTFAQNVPELTHLSLAYWPTADASPEHPDSLSAIRRSLSCLSRCLTKLQYLDVEGCSDWISALSSGPNHGVDWIGGWKNVHCLNLSQGPMPVEVSLEGGLATEKWIQAEVLARQIGDAIDHMRRSRGIPDAPPIHLEHGLGAGNFMINFLVDKAYERSQSGRTCTAESLTGDTRG